VKKYSFQKSKSKDFCRAFCKKLAAGGIRILTDKSKFERQKACRVAFTSLFSSFLPEMTLTRGKNDIIIIMYNYNV